MAPKTSAKVDAGAPAAPVALTAQPHPARDMAPPPDMVQGFEIGAVVVCTTVGVTAGIISKVRGNASLSKQINPTTNKRLTKAEAAIQARAARWVAAHGEEAASKMIRGEIWQGCPEALLLEMVGPPAKVEEEVRKAKTVRVLKWLSGARDSFDFVVTVEDGLVVGWKRK